MVKVIDSFLLLARYVPNVAKRSIWDQWKYVYIDDRPTDDGTTDDRPLIWKILNGQICSFAYGALQIWLLLLLLSPQRVVRSTSSLVLAWGFRGRRIYWRYFRFERIQDGGRRHLGFVRTGNSAIRSAVLENPTLEPNMKWIGLPVAEIWPFEFFEMRGRSSVVPSSVGRSVRRLSVSRLYIHTYIDLIYSSSLL